MQTAIIEPQVETLFPLTTDETRRFKCCERTIERGLEAFYEVGNALAEIRELRLYRIAYPSFEIYCRERWKMSRFYAHRLIDAAQVVENLLPIGNIPSSESQARELAPFTPEVQKAVWHIAMNTAPTNEHGKPMLTAAHIRSVGNVLTEVVKGGGLDDGTGEVKPLGVLIDAAITEETYERVMRQKQHIKEKIEKDKEEAEAKAKAKQERKDKVSSLDGGDEPVLSKQATAFLDDYMGELARWAVKVPADLPETERNVLERMIHEQGADALRLKKRTRQSDCEAIVKVMKDTEAASHTGEMAAADLFVWVENLRYFMTESEFKDRLEYMNQESVRMALLTDAGEEGRQEGRRGALPGIVCVPWRKVWNQTAKRERDEDEE
jgi:hypothetical protein